MDNDVNFYVNEFIEDMIKSGEHFKDSNELNVGFNSNWLKTDPNLNTLRTKLSELGYSLSSKEHNNLWTITKLQ